MIFKRFSNPLIFVGLGAAIVIGTALLVMRPPKPSGAPAPAGTAAAPPAIRGDDLDSARRFDRTNADEPAATVPLVERPAEALRTREPLDRPAELTAEAKAEIDAYAALQKKVAAEVEGQLRGQRSALAQACSGVAGDSGAAFTVQATFDADGKLVDSGIAVPPEAAGSRELGQCLRGQKLALSASPPGQSVSVELPLSLP